MSGKGWQISSSTSGVSFDTKNTSNPLLPVELTLTGSTVKVQPTVEFDVIGANVGIGKTNPQHALDVVGNIGIGSTNSYKIGASDVLTSTALGSGVTASSLTSVGTLTSLTVSGDLTVDTSTLKVDSGNNRVGIGTATPAAGKTLDVVGNIGIGSTNSYKIGASDVLTGTALGSGVTASSLTSVGTLTSLTVSGDMTVDTSTLKVDSGNNRVGIGTATPAAGKTLDVVGNIGIGSTNSYKIGASDVLTSTALGSGVTASSLTSVGTLTSLTVSGDMTVKTSVLKVDSTNNRVGVGTATPATRLHVFLNGNTMRLSGESSACSLEYYAKGASTRSGYVGYSSSSADNLFFVNEINGGDIRLFTYTSGGVLNTFCFSTAGFMGISNSTPSYPLHVSSSTSTNISTVRWFNQASANQTTNLTSEPVSIFASGSVWTTAKFVASSDARIKENISQIDDGEALSKLRLLNPVSYNYIDKVSKSSERVYGFIAQEVGAVLPYAVSQEKEIIPSIFAEGTVNGNVVYLAKNHGLQPEDKVRMIMRDDTDPYGKMYTVSETPSLTSFVVIESCETTDRIFVYGKEVDDFHILDKNAIFTVNVAATQELDRMVQILISIKEDLQTRVSRLEERLAAMNNNM